MSYVLWSNDSFILLHHEKTNTFTAMDRKLDVPIVPHMTMKEMMAFCTGAKWGLEKGMQIHVEAFEKGAVV